MPTAVAYAHSSDTSAVSPDPSASISVLIRQPKTVSASGAVASARVTDADGKPLPDVKISIVNGDEKVLRKSSPLGNIRVQNLLAGDHVLVAEKPGYVKVELPFLVSEPDTTRMTVVMKVMA